MFRSHQRKGGVFLETVGVDPTYGDILDELESASAELSRQNGVPDVAEVALRHALGLTRSDVAFVALYDDEEGADNEGKRIFSLASEPYDGLPDERVETIFANHRVDAMDLRVPLRSTCAQALEVAGSVHGMIGVASRTGYTATQERVFASFSRQVAAALALAHQAERRQEMIDTLVNLRADLDRSEKQRLINQERARSAERLERAHETSVDALLAISRHARTGHGLGDFYRRLTRSIAELVGANKVLFWRLGEDGLLRPIRGAHGITDDFFNRLDPTPCAPDREDAASRVVFDDQMLRTTRADAARDFQLVLDTLEVDEVIAVPWRAGDERLGLVAAYEARSSEGFSREDAWVLQKVGLAAGLVWQLKYAETDLRKTAERLQKVDEARQLLLRNVSTAVDKAQKRIAGDLHDDALQKLTAAELQLQRLQDPNGDSHAALSEAQMLLVETEEAIRRLLFEVRPPALEVPGGFLETIHERVRILKSVTGAEVEMEVDLPDELTYEFRSTLFRQLTEAVANIEKHAAATKVRISLSVHDDGIRGLVEDDGRGFVVAERDRLPGHLGLLALHERALLAGGWNRIRSQPGMGTTVEFWLPLSDAKV